MNHSLIDKTLDIKSIVAIDTKFPQLIDKKEYISINNVFNLIETISSTQNEEILKEDGKQYRIDKENEENEEKLDNKEPPTEKNVTKKKIPEFILIRKKRGRKEKGKRMKIHGKDNFDNLQTKIQVHFLSFIINLSNDVISSELELKKDYNNYAKGSVYMLKASKILFLVGGVLAILGFFFLLTSSSIGSDSLGVSSSNSIISPFFVTYFFFLGFFLPVF